MKLLHYLLTICTIHFLLIHVDSGPSEQHAVPKISKFGRAFIAGVGEQSLWEKVQAKLITQPTLRISDIARQLNVHPSTVLKIKRAWEDGQQGPQATGKQSPSYRYVKYCVGGCVCVYVCVCVCGCVELYVLLWGLIHCFCCILLLC